MNRQSNLYTVIYAVVLVVIVGVVLSIVYQALRPQQVENIANDTKRQILAAALMVPSEGQNVSDLYASHITDSYIVNTEGNRIDSDVNAFDVNVSLEVKKPEAERLLPVFVCKTDGGSKYIIPVYGAGGDPSGDTSLSILTETRYMEPISHIRERLRDLELKLRNLHSATNSKGKTYSTNQAIFSL